MQNYYDVIEQSSDSRYTLDCLTPRDIGLTGEQVNILFPFSATNRHQPLAGDEKITVSVILPSAMKEVPCAESKSNWPTLINGRKVAVFQLCLAIRRLARILREIPDSSKQK